jgi:hypothetical protein
MKWGHFENKRDRLKDNIKTDNKDVKICNGLGGLEQVLVTAIIKLWDPYQLAYKWIKVGRDGGYTIICVKK